MAKPLKAFTWLAVVPIFAAASPALHTDRSDPVYREIPKANAFRLRPLLRPEVAAPPQRAIVRLKGLYAFSGAKQALLQVQMPAASSAQPEIISLLLGEGQSQGEIQVLEIDAHGRSVRILNAGVQTVIGFESQAGAQDVKPGKKRLNRMGGQVLKSSVGWVVV